MANNGSRAERQLVHALEDLGFAVMRAPSSGAGTDSDRPDVLAGRETTSQVIAFEMKSKKDDYIYISKEQVDQLKRFSKAFGAKARIATRWDGDTTIYVGRVEDMDRSELRDEERMYRVKREDATDNWETLEEHVND